MLGAGLALLAGCRCGPTTPPAIASGVRALWALQADDGGWHSETYGFLRPGETLTPFVLATLERVPDLAPPGARDRALAFLAVRGRDGVLGLDGLAKEYPTYATGLALGCLARAGVAPEVRQVMRGWLLRQQRLGSDWGAADGGFAMGSHTPPRPGSHPGHVDLSMTRRAVEGLVADGWEGEAHAGALRFVRRAQRPDGTSVYSVVETALNKGGTDASGTSRGYGSATADGVLALLALGAAADAERGATALRAMHTVDVNPRLGDAHQGYAPAMRGYYRAGAAAVFRRLGGPPGWADPLVTAVSAEQGADGLWRNEHTLQKEDDPLIATPLALSALLDAVQRS